MKNIKETWFWRFANGEKLPFQFLKRNALMLFIIFICVMFQITNRYSVERSRIDVKKMEEQCTAARYEYLSLSSELMERGLQSHVEEYVSKHADKLTIAISPVYVIK